MERLAFAFAVVKKSVLWYRLNEQGFIARGGLKA
jgi:hypothetical protein